LPARDILTLLGAIGDFNVLPYVEELCRPLRNQNDRTA
jgi:hypothetical protein